MVRSIARLGVMLAMGVLSLSCAAEMRDATVLSLFGKEAPHPTFAQRANNGGVVIGGAFDLHSRIFLSKISPGHDVEWTYASEPMNHGLTSTLYGAVELGNGNISACGIDASAQQAWAVLLDHSGRQTTSWKDDNRPTRYATSNFLACTSWGGGMVAVGETYVRGPNEPELHVLIVAFDESLRVLWKTDFPVSFAGVQTMQLRSSVSKSEILLSVVDRRRNTRFLRITSSGKVLMASTVKGDCLLVDAPPSNAENRILCHGDDGGAFTASLPMNLSPQNIRSRIRFNGKFTSAVSDSDGSIVAFGWDGIKDPSPSVWVLRDKNDESIHLSRGTKHEFGFLSGTVTAKNRFTAIAIGDGSASDVLFVHNLDMRVTPSE